MRIGIVDYKFIFGLNPLYIPSPRYAVHRAPLATCDIALVITGREISVHDYEIGEYNFRHSPDHDRNEKGDPSPFLLTRDDFDPSYLIRDDLVRRVPEVTTCTLNPKS
ncbi:Hypothetical predicted protein [Prunus dulcis]|uniref:Uncharacterized protein n=1 Tax=Prunus dulcis TaxID=3755 RepID=A0A5E4EX27_PRUDU|nr:hypothetical protein L3X38_008818 [Prunus dulcis]VVA20284.1 Hypothetical predicted protein [Prunus dulcis]